MQNRLPFTLSKNESFTEKLSQWVGDVFYDILPEAGFELREQRKQQESREVATASRRTHPSGDLILEA